MAAAKARHELLAGAAEMLDRPADEHRRFRVGRSLRDVEPEVQLFLKELGT